MDWQTEYAIIERCPHRQWDRESPYSDVETHAAVWSEEIGEDVTQCVYRVMEQNDFWEFYPFENME